MNYSIERMFDECRGRDEMTALTEIQTRLGISNEELLRLYHEWQNSPDRKEK